MPAGRFHWGEVLESFLGQPPLAGFPVLVDGSGAQRGGTGNLRCSSKPAPAKAGGLKNAIAAVFAGASWQRCRTHFMANLLTRVPKRAQPGVATMVRTIYQQLSPAEVHGQLDRVVEQLREPFAQVAELLADAAPDILAFTAFPVAHWQKLWSNNPQERLNREIRRRRACPRKGTWWAFSPTGCRRGAWWARCWPSNTTNGPKPAATSPSPTPPATRHCRSPICWTQRPDQHQKG